ncbi:MAG: hypothetical protein WCS65_17550 [Verrucomicrobiae bacterium]
MKPDPGREYLAALAERKEEIFYKNPIPANRYTTRKMLALVAVCGVILSIPAGQYSLALAFLLFALCVFLHSRAYPQQNFQRRIDMAAHQRNGKLASDIAWKPHMAELQAKRDREDPEGRRYSGPPPLP